MYIIAYTEGYYVQFIVDGKVVDLAGPFDEEWEAEECANRYLGV